MFSDELKNISWEETTERIARMTDNDVRRALAKDHCDVNDFMALISPAAEPYLEVMARLSRKYTEERFGKTMSMFIPLYITNSCSNSCVYCGFHRENPMHAPSSPQSRLRTSTRLSSSWLHSRTSFSLRARTQPRLAPLILPRQSTSPRSISLT